MIREERSRRRTLLDAALGASIVLSAASGLVAYYFVVHFDFDTDPPGRDAYVGGVGAMLASILILGLAHPVLRWLGAATWTYVLAGVGILLQLVLLGDCAVNASIAAKGGFAEYDFFGAMLVVTWIPGNWPLLLLIVIALVRVLTAPSSPGPRAQRDR